MPSVKLKVLLGYMMTSALIPCLHPKSAVSMGTGVSTQGQRGGVNEEGVSARGVVLGRLSRAQGSPPSSPSRLHSQDLTPSKELTERPVTGPKAIEQMGRALWAPAAPRVLQTWSSHLQMGPATLALQDLVGFNESGWSAAPAPCIVPESALFPMNAHLRVLEA